MDFKKTINLIICILVPLIIFFLPNDVLAHMLFIKGQLTLVEHRVFSIFVMAVFFWILEPIPTFATSMMILGLGAWIVSDGGFDAFKQGDNLGDMQSYKDIFAYLGAPIVMLFLSAFFIAEASKKYALDVALTKIVIKLFKGDPKLTMLGGMFITALLAMFITNTAATAMIIPAFIPIINSFKSDDKGKIGFTLSIPFAANVGGQGTTIGTPPVALGIEYLPDDQKIGFVQWMSFSLPNVFILLFFIWVLLMIMFPFKEKKLNFDTSGKIEFKQGFHAWVLYITFAGSIIIRFFTKSLGLNSYTVSMFIVVIFLVTSVIDKKDLSKLSWSVLWLMAGAVGLGGMIDKSGLALEIVKAIPFDKIPVTSIIIISTLTTLFFGTFMSHTASTALMIPMLVPLGNSIPALKEVGGAQLLVTANIFASSLAMALPMTTPPNAIAYSYGFLKTKHIALPGVIVGLFGLVLSWVVVYVLATIHYFK